jgi:dethiobiotin synthetase
MQNAYFITGTDTNVGKTYVSVSLLNAFNQMGYSTLGLKPIASGCRYQGSIMVNDDALALQEASSIKLDYDLINPIRFEAPIAPHIAASYSSTIISLKELNERTNTAITHSADIKVIEGAGGWYTPLNENELFSDYAIHHQFKVILVVGMRLGCINHSILTYQALLQSQLSIVGWIANFPTPDVLSEANEIEATLKNYIRAPFLGRIRYAQEPELYLSRLKSTK